MSLVIIKKSGRNIFGANLTAAEQKALDIEIKRQLAEYTKKHELEVEAMVLFMLHSEFGFGEKRLKQAHISLTKGLDNLAETYQMDESDTSWLCLRKLKDAGFDISKWED